MSASIAEQIEKRSAPSRPKILRDYRQAVQRSHAPRDGDAVLLVEQGRRLGLSEADIVLDIRAWEEARKLAAEVPTGEKSRALAERREAAQRALDEATVQTASAVAGGLPSGRLTAAAMELRN